MFVSGKPVGLRHQTCAVRDRREEHGDGSISADSDAAVNAPAVRAPAPAPAPAAAADDDAPAAAGDAPAAAGDAAYDTDDAGGGAAAAGGADAAAAAEAGDDVLDMGDFTSWQPDTWDAVDFNKIPFPTGPHAQHLFGSVLLCGGYDLVARPRPPCQARHCVGRPHSGLEGRLSPQPYRS